VSQNLVRISPSRVRSGFSQGLLYAAEPPIPDEWGIDLLSVEYPSRSIEVFGWRLHWLVCFFALSCIFAFAFKRLLRVEL
jgi:hypothetical protein